MCCCLRRIVRRVDSVGCAVNTGSMLQLPMSASTSSSDRPCAFRRASASSHAARLRALAVLQEVLAAAADAMHLLGEVDHLEPGRRRRAPGRAPAVGGRPCTRAHELGAGARRRPRGARWRATRSCSTRSSSSGAALLPQDLADERAERVHVLAQRFVLRREMDLAADHGARILLSSTLRVCFARNPCAAAHTQKRWPVGASITHQRVDLLHALRAEASRRCTSASMSSVSMSRCTRLGCSTFCTSTCRPVGPGVEACGSLLVRRRTCRARSPSACVQNAAAASRSPRLAIDDESGEAALVHGALRAQ